MDTKLLVYMAGENDLGEGRLSKAVEDILELEKEGPSPKLPIFVQVDGNEQGDTYRYNIEKCTTICDTPISTNIAPEGFEVDSGSPEALIDFLDVGVDQDLDNSLIIWGHGTGWIPSPTSKTGNSRSYLFSHKTLEEVGYKSVARDDFSGSSLDARELRKIFSTKLGVGIPFLLLGFDACLMASLELLYELRNYTEIFIASMEEVPKNGWPYSELVKTLKEKEDSWTVATEIVDSYVKYYEDSDNNSILNSAIRSFDLNDISSVVESFTSKCLLMLNDPEIGILFKVVIKSALSDGYTVKGPAIDILSFAYFVIYYINELNVNDKHGVEESYLGLTNVVSNSIYFKAHPELSDPSPKCGLSIWRPLYKANWVEDVFTEYKNLEFYKKFPSWGDLMMKIYDIGN